MRNPGQIAAEAADQTENTHGPGAQASAARLIRLLRNDFPIKKPPQTAVASNQSVNDILTDVVTEEEKKCLTDYLNTLSKLSNNTLPKKPENTPHIQGILHFIEYIVSHTQVVASFADLEKREIVFSEIKRLVDRGRDHWTQNTCYENGETITVDASLGETLDLVCSGSLRNYPNLENNNETDKQDRVRALFNYLENSPRDRKCTGGEQHDLLFLLNHVYPEIQADGSYRPIVLIEDVDAFLLERINDFLSKQVKSDFQNIELFEFTKNWILHQTGQVTGIPKALNTWLQTKKIPLKKYLTTQCSFYGLNPNDPRIMKSIGNLCDSLVELNTPSDIHSMVPAMVETLSARPTQKDTVIRNQALEEITESIKKANDFDTLAQPISFFLGTERSYQKLIKYAPCEIFIGEIEGEFQKSMIVLTRQLQYRFDQIVTGNISHIDDNAFLDAKSKFLKQEEEYKKTHPIEFITDFFGILMSQTRNVDLIYKLYEKLQAEHQKKSLLLNDANITQWLNKNRENLDSTSQNIVDITPYEVNRILLHALLTYNTNETWGDIFQSALMLVTTWLLNPPTESTIANTAFRAAYNRTFLANLQCITLIRHLSFCNAMIKRQSIYDLYNDSSLLLKIFQNPSLRAEQHDQIFAVTQYHFGRLIQNATELRYLFDCATLRKEYRTKILNDVKNKLGDLLQDEDQLIFLLKSEKLENEHRTQILQEMSTKSGGFIQSDVHALRELLELKTLTSAHRMQILMNEKTTDALIQNADHLGCLLNDCEPLEEEHCTQILKNIEKKLGELIPNVNQLIYLLNCEKLIELDRTKILKSVENKLGEFIQNTAQLISLLNCKKLTESDRAKILKGVEKKLGFLISTNELELTKLLHCKKLTDWHRAKILAVFITLIGTDNAEFSDRPLGVKRHEQGNALWLISHFALSQPTYTDILLKSILYIGYENELDEAVGKDKYHSKNSEALLQLIRCMQKNVRTDQQRATAEIFIKTAITEVMKGGDSKTLREIYRIQLSIDSQSQTASLATHNPVITQGMFAQSTLPLISKIDSQLNAELEKFKQDEDVKNIELHYHTITVLEGMKKYLQGVLNPADFNKIKQNNPRYTEDPVSKDIVLKAEQTLMKPQNHP